MDVFAPSILFLVVAAVGLRSRKPRSDDVPDEGPSTKPPPQASQEYMRSLLIPMLVGAVLFGIYYSIPRDIEIQESGIPCRGPTPKDRAAQWEYELPDPALKNVSQEEAVRKLFSQGLLLRFGYSPEGARTSFSAASDVDPSCAMCYWGLAYAVAPFLNIVALPDDTRHPYYSTKMNEEGRAFLKAAQRGPFRSTRHRSYIEAMWIRFPYVQAVERKHQEWREFLYGARMLSLWRDDPSDVTSACLAAEAFANYGPWEFHADRPQPSVDDMTWADLIRHAFPNAKISEFELTTGVHSTDGVMDWLTKSEAILQARVAGNAMRPIARLAESIVLEILRLDDAHPMATHLHIHLVEATKGWEPNKALMSASKLDRVSRQWKSGHLVHMPSHIYLRVGEYRRGVDVNEVALDMDIETSRSCVDPYVPEHNLKLLIASASMGGLLKEAEVYAVKLRKLPEQITMRRYISSGWEYVSLLEVWGHFGKWKKILWADPPSKGARGGSGTGGWEYAQAMYLFYRAMALSHIGRSTRRLLEVDNEIEMDQFLEAAKAVPTARPTIPGEGIGIYAAAYPEKTEMASLYIRARNASLHGDLVSLIMLFNVLKWLQTRAIGFVREVIDVVKKMGYIEPPWPQQAPKQCLGYLLMLNKQYDEAREVFEEDLEENPKNPWSMMGSAQVAKAAGRQNDAQAFLSEFASTASVPLKCSCPILYLSGS